MTFKKDKNVQISVKDHDKLADAQFVGSVLRHSGAMVDERGDLKLSGDIRYVAKVLKAAVLKEERKIEIRKNSNYSIQSYQRNRDQLKALLDLVNQIVRGSTK